MTESEITKIDIAEEDKGMEKFKKELEDLINAHCIENECDVPDFILAEMICNFIKAIGEPIKQTLDWHGCDSITHPSNKEQPLS